MHIHLTTRTLSCFDGAAAPRSCSCVITNEIKEDDLSPKPKRRGDRTNEPHVSCHWSRGDDAKGEHRLCSGAFWRGNKKEVRIILYFICVDTITKTSPLIYSLSLHPTNNHPNPLGDKTLCSTLSIYCYVHDYPRQNQIKGEIGVWCWICVDTIPKKLTSAIHSPSTQPTTTPIRSATKPSV